MDMSKTEALHRLLRDAVQQEARKQKKSKFREVAYSIMEQARQENQNPTPKKKQMLCLRERASECC